MEARRDNARDLVVALLCLTAIAATAYSLYLDGVARLDAGDAAPAGEISFRQGEARRRYASRALWEELEAGDIVYDRNSVRTGDGSEARIRLNDNTRIELDPNTMIVLNIRDDEIRIDLKEGSLEIHRSRPRYDQALTVGRGDHVLRLDSGQVRLDALDEQGLQVTPQLGRVVVTDTRREIRAGDRMILSGEARKEILQFHLLHPRQGQSISARPAGPAPVTLLWKVAHNLPPTTRTRPPVHVEVSADPRFERIVERRSYNVDQDRAELQLPDGVYYWRVRRAVTAATGQGGPRIAAASATGKFRVLRVEPVAIVTPDASGVARPDHGTQDSGILFAWRPVPAARHYRLEIYRDAALTDRIVSKKVEREYVQVPLPPGQYHFRVQSFGSGPERTRVSAVRSFRTVERTLAANPDASDDPSDNPTIRPTASALAGHRETEAPAPLSASGFEAGATPLPRTEILYPARGETVDMAQLDSVDFHWRPARHDVEQRFRLYDTTNGPGRLLYETITREDRLRFDRLRQLSHGGTYRWSVEVPGLARVESSTFRIVLSSQPDSPEFITGADPENDSAATAAGTEAAP